MPGFRPAKEEALWLRKCQGFIDRHCDEKGEQLTQNLSEAAMSGYKKVAKLVRKKQAVVMPSNKGRGVVVVEWDLYQQMGNDTLWVTL